MIPIQTHHLESLGWTLIHFCWQAAAIAITYKLADLSITHSARRATSQTRYIFALAAMLCMFAAAAGTLLYEELRLQHAPTAIRNRFGSNKYASQPPPHQPPLSAEAATHTSPRCAKPSTAASHIPKPSCPGSTPYGCSASSPSPPAPSADGSIVQRLRTTATQQIPPDSPPASPASPAASESMAASPCASLHASPARSP